MPTPSRLPLSVAVITRNEETNLPRCLASVAELASEIVVVDSDSTDGTETAARGFGARFLTQPWQGHVRQKNLALAACSQPWVLSLDADEALSAALAASLRGAFSGPPGTTAGYEVNRRTFYLGAWLDHSWYPEWRLRLVRRAEARWTGRDPHDRLAVDGPTARLAGDLLHYSYRDLRDHFERTIHYARISADGLAQSARPARWYHLVLSPWLAMGKRLLLKQGFRDGWRGWIIAGTTGFSVFAKYAFRFERQKSSATPSPSPSLPPATSPPQPPSTGSS